MVGITQCPISPYTSFKYEFEVEEVPGTYWWHTHSGTLGIHAINAIHGPLIVHPAGEEKRELVDRLNGKTNEDEGVVSSNIDSPWYYGDERILFFKVCTTRGYHRDAHKMWSLFFFFTVRFTNVHQLSIIHQILSRMDILNRMRYISSINLVDWGRP